MNISQIYIAVSIVVLAVIAFLVFFVSKNRREKTITPSAGLAFGFVLAGMFVGDNTFIGYRLMGVGVLLAVIDMFNKSRKKYLPSLKYMIYLRSNLESN